MHLFPTDIQIGKCCTRNWLLFKASTNSWEIRVLLIISTLNWIIHRISCLLNWITSINTVFLTWIRWIIIILIAIFLSFIVNTLFNLESIHIVNIFRIIDHTSIILHFHLLKFNLIILQLLILLLILADMLRELPIMTSRRTYKFPTGSSIPS